jgi:hypothetical protein
VIVLDGREYGTTAEIVAMLGPDITAETIRNWRRRDGLTSYRVGSVVYSPLAEAAAIERAKRVSGRGRPRQPVPAWG